MHGAQSISLRLEGIQLSGTTGGDGKKGIYGTSQLNLREDGTRRNTIQVIYIQVSLHASKPRNQPIHFTDPNHFSMDRTRNSSHR